MMSRLELVALVVREYEPAIDFFVNVLQFELVEDVPSQTNDGRPKRWVVVRPVGAATGLLLARDRRRTRFRPASAQSANPVFVMPSAPSVPTEILG
jgi:catechol 2,3-dioxygenase-like lactoylglutathione lyase family enzyme